MSETVETILLYTIGAGLLSIVYGFFTGKNILSQSAGNAKMQDIASAIQIGAKAYLARQYKTIAVVGVVVLVRIMDGVLAKGDKIKMFSNGSIHSVERVGVFRPEMQSTEQLGPGEIGFITASIKQVRDTKVGDTITHEKKGTEKPIPGFNPSQPVVFCGLFPVDSSEFEDLREAIEKLALNDASFSFEMETSAALGFGFRCGFLGLLHLEVIRDRVEREYDIELITTAPSVIYHIYMKDENFIQLHNPADMPDLSKVDHLEEPRIKATILVPDDFLGDVLKLCQDRRGTVSYTHLRAPRPY